MQLKPRAMFGSPLAVAALALGMAGGASAHDFWIQPNAYWVQRQAVAALTLQVGHGPARRRSPIPASRITRFQSIEPNGVVADLRGRLRLGSPLDDGDIALRTAGAQVLVLETDDGAQTHLPALRFNDYLQVEGLTPALNERVRQHRMDRDASENYSRCAKTIVQVGPASTDGQAQVTRATGLPLEIVPENSPYALPRSPTLAVRVFYRGRRLPGALVKLTRLEDDALPFESHRTDAAGRAVFGMPSAGSWLLNVIWTRPQPRDAETDFETTFSSLSFGFPAGRSSGARESLAGLAR